MKNKKMYYGIALLVSSLLIGFMFMSPANSLTMDVNPSIELVTNRLDRVVEINPLNEDAEKLLKDFESKDKNLETTVNDLVDLMILTGHIKGGEDNFVMLTVEDSSVDSKFVDRVNRAIAAMLENKQIEATVLNQSINAQEKESGQTGTEIVAQRLKQIDSRLSIEEIEDMTVRELVQYANENNIVIENLFKLVDSRLENKENTKETKNVKITADKAKSIALSQVKDAVITEFEVDDNEYEIDLENANNKYEIELDAYSGKVIKFESETKDKQKSKPVKSSTTNSQTSAEQAKKIALDFVGGGNITDFELDDGKYEIEIKTNSHEYEIEISAHSGQIIEFEEDDLDD